MEFASVREFKTHVSEFIRKKEAVMVFRSGKPAGVFVPWEDLNIEDDVRRAALKALAAKIAKEREKKGITEEEVLEDFATFRKDRRGRERGNDKG
jgi:PHD/YefM family antitoxin component YafN of YafNO toxin-antitoxin module